MSATVQTYHVVKDEIFLSTRRIKVKKNIQYFLECKYRSVLSHEWKTFNICLYNNKIYFSLWQMLLNLYILENANCVLIARARSKVTPAYYWTLHCTIVRYYCTLTSHAFNCLSIFIMWPCIIQSNYIYLHWVFFIIYHISVIWMYRNIVDGYANGALDCLLHISASSSMKRFLVLSTYARDSYSVGKHQPLTKTGREQYTEVCLHWFSKHVTVS